MPNQNLLSIALAFCFLAGCSNSDFVTKVSSKDKSLKSTASGETTSGSDANSQPSTVTKPGGENIRGPFKTQRPSAGPESIGIPENQFAAAGKSFDLHAIFDVSDSLSHPMLGTDPKCLRYSAFKTFVGALKTKLGAGADARLSITTFNSNASFKGTHEDFLDLRESDFDQKFKKIICKSDGMTNVAEAFKVAAEEAEPLLANSPKQVASVLFFSDGNPTRGSMEDTFKNAEKLRRLFNNRVFGIRLTGPQMLVLGIPIDRTDEFMKKVIGSKERVRQVNDAGDLAATMTSLLD